MSLSGPRPGRSAVTHPERTRDYLEHIADAIERARLRNKIIHDYFDVAWDVVWNTIQQDLPLLLKQINTLLQTQEP